MGIVGRATGIILLFGGAIFVWQVLEVAMETSSLPRAEVKDLPGGGVSVDLRRFGTYDFLFTREAFLLLHIWLVWAIVRLRKAWPTIGLADKLIGGAAILAIGAGHAIGLWVAHQGPSVGIW